jgi:hypothetical protein
MQAYKEGAWVERNTPATPWLARSNMRVLATCPACGGNGHGRFTAVTPLLAVARHFGVALVVSYPRFQRAPARARVHVPRRAALRMGHLMGYIAQASANQTSKPTFRLGSIVLLWHQCAETGRQLGETVLAMHSEVCEGGREWRE